MKHIINAKSTISNVDAKCIQPNAVDLRIKQVFIIGPEPFVLMENKKIHRNTQELFADEKGFFNLQANQHYDIVLDHNCKIAEGEAGWLIARSSLNRNGLFITSGLYDSGFDNTIGCVLHVNCGPAHIKKGTRIAQFLLFNAETVHLYDGDYNRKDDSHE